MKVYLIGQTRAALFHPNGEAQAFAMPGEAALSKFERKHYANAKGWESPFSGEALVEFSGRLCYESWSMPNEATSTREGYISNILAQGHESVLEHVSVTFYVEGVSRNLSHELIRHRHLSFSELSQRFVDMKDANFVNPPAMRTDEELYPMHDSAEVAEYEETVARLIDLGKTRKQAREAARFFLPSGMETKFVVTGNLRAWRDVLKKRDSEHADAEMQLLAKEIKRQLLKEYPNVFKDLNEDRSDGETA